MTQAFTCPKKPRISSQNPQAEKTHVKSRDKVTVNPVLSRNSEHFSVNGGFNRFPRCSGGWRRSGGFLLASRPALVPATEAEAAALS